MSRCHKRKSDNLLLLIKCFLKQMKSTYHLLLISLRYTMTVGFRGHKAVLRSRPILAASVILLM